MPIQSRSLEFDFQVASTSAVALAAHNAACKAMSVSNSQSLIERIPTELLERIFLFTSVRDILRLSLVRKIAKVTLIREFTEDRNPERSIALSAALCEPLPRSNTRSTFLVPDCSITHGRKHLWPIAAQLLKRIAAGGQLWILPKSGKRFLCSTA